MLQVSDIVWVALALEPTGATLLQTAHMALVHLDSTGEHRPAYFMRHVHAVP